MSIFGISGAIGTGKSFLQLLLALDYANEREKQLVFNFNINIKELEILCKMPKWIDKFPWSILSPLIGDHIKPSGTQPRYPWILHMIKNGGISCIPNPKNLQALMIPNSVVCLDEAGILLNSRDFMNTPKALLADLCQSRKDGVDLFWAAQFDEQVDKQFRLLTQFWIHADGLAVYDKKMKRPKLVYQKYYWFRAADYFEWLHSKDRSNHFKTRFNYASKYIGRFLTLSDKQLFKIFDSFARLDLDGDYSSVSTIYNSPLNFSYYYSKLGYFYDSSLNPFSKDWQPFVYIPSSSSPSTPPPTRSSVGAQPTKSDLIRKAISLSRSLQISPPYFKEMNSADISSWIAKNSSRKKAKNF